MSCCKPVCNKKCHCNDHCNCCNKCGENDVYMFLGKYTFNLLYKLDIPCGHPSLIESLCLLIKGAKLPPGHPTLDQLLLIALKEHKCSCDHNCHCKYFDKCSEHEIYMFLGKYTFNLLSKLDIPCGHPSLIESICLLIEGKELPCGHPTLDELLLIALK